MRKFPLASLRNPERVEVFDRIEQEVTWIITLTLKMASRECLMSVVKGDGS